jgi:hypothetical protein
MKGLGQIMVNLPNDDFIVAARLDNSGSDSRE